MIEELKDFDWGWMNNGTDQGNYHKQTIIGEIFSQRAYERFFEVEKGDIVLDIGASVGPFTKSILDKKPKHVFCLEPSFSEFRCLVKNTIGYPVTHINKGIWSINGSVESDQLFGGESVMETFTFQYFINLFGIEKIDFLKTDCEGGEYEIFQSDNIKFLKNNVKKIVGEWHLRSAENKKKFKNFRDTILPNFEKYEIYSIDGIDIKWDLYNDHFLDYYEEVIIYIDNRDI
jgi:FkbM family methyltransferase